jgi:hypothetical protein
MVKLTGYLTQNPPDVKWEEGDGAPQTTRPAVWETGQFIDGFRVTTKGPPLAKILFANGNQLLIVFVQYHVLVSI